MSLVCYAVYAADKKAARRGRGRISEKVLLMLGLLGGWPGGLVAQRTLRHKTMKGSFQVAFWITAIVNTALLLALVFALNPDNIR